MLKKHFAHPTKDLCSLGALKFYVVLCRVGNVFLLPTRGLQKNVFGLNLMALTIVPFPPPPRAKAHG